MDALGSETAPAPPGHSAQQVRRQDRDPICSMPRFGEGVISDDELDGIAEFIAGLPGGMAHAEPVPLSESEALTMHLSMALLALKAENAAEARHHQDHALDCSADEHQRESVGRVREAFDGADLHAAGHELEGLLAGRGEPELDLVDDAADVEHHLRHAEERITAPERLDAVRDALGHMVMGAMEGAEHTVGEMMAGGAHHHDE